MNICSVENCENQSRANGMCNKHNLRVRRTGTPDDTRRSHAEVRERFFRHIEKTDECWVWTGNTSRRGYGSLQEGGRGSKTISAHRYSYEVHRGPIPDGLVVMHSCDNPSCVNPDHLSVGTYRENTQDMIRKGRKRTVAPTGTGNGKSKLNDDLVRYIRQNKEKSHASLARELGLSQNCIRGVRTRRTWGHVSD
jgi:hypothetical protein